MTKSTEVVAYGQIHEDGTMSLGDMQRGGDTHRLVIRWTETPGADEWTGTVVVTRVPHHTQEPEHGSGARPKA